MGTSWLASLADCPSSSVPRVGTSWLASLADCWEQVTLHLRETPLGEGRQLSAFKSLHTPRCHQASGLAISALGATAEQFCLIMSLCLEPYVSDSSRRFCLQSDRRGDAEVPHEGTCSLPSSDTLSPEDADFKVKKQTQNPL